MEWRTNWAARWGGAVGAMAYWVCPAYEPPNVPTLPLHHFCLAMGFHGVVAVPVFTPAVVAERVELTLRVEPAPRVLDHYRVAARREVRWRAYLDYFY